jgi:hypothetical protein
VGVIIPAGFGSVKLLFDLIGGGAEMVTTFGVDCDISAPAVTNATAIDNIFTATSRPCNNLQMSTGYNYRGLELTQMTMTGPVVGVVGHLTPGTSAISPVPPNSAFILRKNTARGGRKGQGRCFLPPCWVAEGNVDSAGVIAGTQLAALNVLWGNALTALVTAGIPAVLLHSDGSTPDTITSWFVEAQCGTQRRRMRR